MTGQLFPQMPEINKSFFAKGLYVLEHAFNIQTSSLQLRIIFLLMFVYHLMISQRREPKVFLGLSQTVS